MSKPKRFQPDETTRNQKTPEQEISDSYNSRMADVKKIINMYKEGVPEDTIASRSRMAQSYISEVLKKGEATMSDEIRKGYGLASYTTSIECKECGTPIEDGKCIYCEKEKELEDIMKRMALRI